MILELGVRLTQELGTWARIRIACVAKTFFLALAQAGWYLVFPSGKMSLLICPIQPVSANSLSSFGGDLMPSLPSASSPHPIFMRVQTQRLQSLMSQRQTWLRGLDNGPQSQAGGTLGCDLAECNQLRGVTTFKRPQDTSSQSFSPVITSLMILST